MAESTNTPGTPISEYFKGAFAGFYNPILGIRDLSAKMSTTAAVVFSGACALALYILAVIMRSFSARDYPDDVFFSIVIDSFITYALMTFGIAGIAWVISKIQGTNGKFSELLGKVTMSIVPGALITIWGSGLSFVPYAGTFFSIAGRAYIAILLFENLKDDRLSGRKQFFTAAVIAALGIAIAYIF